MKRKKVARIYGVALALMLGMATFAGCSDKTEQSQESQVSASQESSTQEGSQTDKESSSEKESSKASEESSEEGIQVSEDGFYHVSSVEELLEAIRPGAGISIAPGKYNLTEFLNQFSDKKKIAKWNSDHPYVQINEVFDGLEIWIHSAPDLYIEGGSKNAADTEIVTDPRYAALFTFSSCSNLELRYLTMGHTERGNCSGNVLNFISCRKVKMMSMDLYGCGVFGIGAENRCSDFTVTDSIIRDCEYGPLAMDGCKGDFVFENCALTGSLGGGYFEEREDASLTFRKCSFGEHESNTWYFNDYVNYEDCVWSEITEYPDYEYPDIEG